MRHPKSHSHLWFQEFEVFPSWKAIFCPHKLDFPSLGEKEHVQELRWPFLDAIPDLPLHPRWRLRGQMAAEVNNVKVYSCVGQLFREFSNITNVSSSSYSKMMLLHGAHCSRRRSGPWRHNFEEKQQSIGHAMVQSPAQTTEDTSATATAI